MGRSQQCAFYIVSFVKHLGYLRLKQLVLDIFRSRLDHTKPTIPATNIRFPKISLNCCFLSILLSHVSIMLFFTVSPFFFFCVGNQSQKTWKVDFPRTSTKKICLSLAVLHQRSRGFSWAHGLVLNRSFQEFNVNKCKYIYVDLSMKKKDLIMKHDVLHQKIRISWRMVNSLDLYGFTHRRIGI